MQLFVVFSISAIAFTIAAAENLIAEASSPAKEESQPSTAADKLSKESLTKATTAENDDDSGRQKKSFPSLQKVKATYGDPVPLKINNYGEPVQTKPISYPEPVAQPLPSYPINLGYFGEGEPNHPNYVEGAPLITNYDDLPKPNPVQYKPPIYSAPKPNYGVLAAYPAAKPNYGAPIYSQNNYGEPVQYKPPAYHISKPVYGTPSPPKPYEAAPYKPPTSAPAYKSVVPQQNTQSYRVPAPEYPTSIQYPSPVYNEPSIGYGAPVTNCDPASQKNIVVGCLPTTQLVPCQGGYGGYGSGYSVGGYGYGGSY